MLRRLLKNIKKKSVFLSDIDVLLGSRLNNYCQVEEVIKKTGHLTSEKRRKEF